MRKPNAKGTGFGLLVLLFLIGFASSGFGYLSMADCRFCHNQNPPPEVPVDSTSMPDRHHLLVNQPIPPDSEAPNPNIGGGTYDCLTCHTLVWDPDLGAYVFEEDFRDCLTCHLPSTHHDDR